MRRVALADAQAGAGGCTGRRWRMHRAGRAEQDVFNGTSLALKTFFFNTDIKLKPRTKKERPDNMS